MQAEAETLRVVWTKHAVERAMERFGPDDSIRIPNRIIIKAGRETPIGQDTASDSGRSSTCACVATTARSRLLRSTAGTGSDHLDRGSFRNLKRRRCSVMVKGKLYEEVGFACGTVEQDGREIEVVGIMYPVGDEPPADPDDDDAYETRWMPLATAQSLIAGLQEAVGHCLAHQRGE